MTRNGERRSGRPSRPRRSPSDQGCTSRRSCRSSRRRRRGRRRPPRESGWTRGRTPSEERASPLPRGDPGGKRTADPACAVPQVVKFAINHPTNMSLPPSGKEAQQERSGAKSRPLRHHLDMATTATRDRLRTLIDVLVDSLGEPARGDELARRAYLSRFHTLRNLGADIGSPDPLEWERRAA